MVLIGEPKSIYDQSVQVEQLMAAAGENINTNLTKGKYE